MADIKTRDAVKGTIKTIDKAAVRHDLPKGREREMPTQNIGQLPISQ